MDKTPDKSDVCQVASVSWKRHLKYLRIEPGGQRISVPLSACVGKGSNIRVENGNAWVICKNGESQFLPPYFVRETLHLGSLELETAVKGITEEDEYDSYSSLAEFHYRGHVIHGRTARLTIRTFHPRHPLPKIDNLKKQHHRLFQAVPPIQPFLSYSGLSRSGNLFLEKVFLQL